MYEFYTLEIERKRYPLKPGNTYLIGRKLTTDASHYIAVENESVAEKHAIVDVGLHIIQVTDLLSASGTYVSGRRISSLVKEEITAVDSLQFGNVVVNLQKLASEDSNNSSGFIDGQKDISDAIVSTPEISASAPPRMLADYRITTGNNFEPPAKQHVESPASLNRTVNDSFIIPATQHIKPQGSLNITDITDPDLDNEVFIPETQDVLDIINEYSSAELGSRVSGNESEKLLCSQFRIATPEYDDFQSDSDSIDLLAKYDSLSIPLIQHNNLHLSDSGTVQNKNECIANEIQAESGTDSGLSDICRPFAENPEQRITSNNVTARSITPDLLYVPGQINEQQANTLAPAENAFEENPEQSTMSNNITGRSVTPDLFSVPHADLDQINKKQTKTWEPVENQKLEDNVTNTTHNACTSKPSNMDEDLLSTQIFPPIADVKKSKSLITLYRNASFTADLEATQVFEPQPKQQQAMTENPSQTSLSDKENYLCKNVPSDESILEKTQVFGAQEFVAESNSNDDNRSESGDVDVRLAQTQVFTYKLPIPLEIENPNICFNSTFINSEDAKKSRNAEFFFTELGEQLETMDGPECELPLSQNADIPNREFENTQQLLMNTPQLIKKTFEKPSNNTTNGKPFVVKEALFKKSNANEESENILDIMTAPKISNQFAFLVPHLVDNDIKQQAIEEALSNNNKEMTNVQIPKEGEKKTSRNREERYVARKTRLNSGKSEASAASESNSSRRFNKSTEDIRKLPKSNCSETDHKPKDIGTDGHSMSKVKKTAAIKTDESKGVKDKQTGKISKRCDAESSGQKTREKLLAAVESSETSHSSSSSPIVTYVKTANRKTKCSESQSTIKDLKKVKVNDSSKGFLKTENQVKDPENSDGASKSSRQTRQNQLTAQTDSVSRKMDPRNSNKRNKTVDSAVDQEVKNERSEAVAVSGPESRAKRKSRKESETSSTSGESRASEVSYRPTTSKRTELTNNQTETPVLRSRSKSIAAPPENESTSVGSSTQRKRKNSPDPPAELEKKRLCNDPAIKQGSTKDEHGTNAAQGKLKVSITMVNQELFTNLAEYSCNAWTIAENPTESDILVMDKGNRTFKFLVAMAKGIPIVHSSWLESVNKTKSIPSMSRHFFKDRSFEKRYKFSLLSSLQKSRTRKIFEDYVFLTTPNVKPSPQELKAIITCAGGTIVTQISTSLQADHKLYLISSLDDKKYWHQYRRGFSELKIISTEAIMAAVMRQVISPLDEYALE